MKFNASHRFTTVLEDIPQLEILHCPQYHAMSLEAVMNLAPQFLKDRLDRFPWTGRQACLQISTQDWFMKESHTFKGAGAHLDLNVEPLDGVYRTAPNFTDWQLYSVSFGGVTETEFMAEEIEADESDLSGPKYVSFFQRLNGTFRRPAPCQLVEYTGRDIHRVGTRIGPRNNQLRLLIVAIEATNIETGGIVLPSLRERGISWV